MTTFAPPNPSSSAMARPIPLPAPVTTATAPSRLPTTDSPSHASLGYIHRSDSSLPLLPGANTACLSDDKSRFALVCSVGVTTMLYSPFLVRRVRVKDSPQARKVSSRRRVRRKVGTPQNAVTQYVRDHRRVEDQRRRSTPHVRSR